MVLAHLSLPIEGHLHIFGFLKAHKIFRLMFDSDRPQISTHKIKSYDCFDFYKDTKQAIPPGMSQPRGPPMPISTFVDVDLTDVG